MTAREAVEWSRRAALGALAVGAAGFVAWPHRPRSAESIPSGRRVLTYWEKWTGPEGEAIQQIVDLYNASQSRAWVRRVPVSDIAAKAMVAISGDDAPDVVGLFNYHIPLFAESRAVFALDEFDPGDFVNETHYAAPVWDLLVHEGRQWAGVSTAFTLALYYNRSLFRRAGLGDGPRTLAELDADVEALTEVDGSGRMTQAGFMPIVPDWWPYFWPIPFGGTLYDAPSNRATLHTPANVAAFDWVGSFPRRYGRFGLTSFATGFNRSFLSPQDPFLTGRVAMVPQGPWMANFARRYAPELEYGCVPFPAAYAAPGPIGMMEADVLMIPRNAREPEEAYAFIRFVQRQEIQERLATLHCKGSPLREVSSAFRREHPNPYVAIHDEIARSPAVQSAPPTRIWLQYAMTIKSAFDAVWSGGDADRELATAQARVQPLLDVAADRRRRRNALREGAST